MKLSVVIIAKNAADKINVAIESVKSIALEVIVLDGDSTDNTVQISKNLGARIVKQKDSLSRNFAQWRNEGMVAARGDWVLYLDYDEKITPELAREIKSIIIREPLIVRHKIVAYAIPRLNVIFGREMRYGGWYPDYQQRLFLKSNFIKWVGLLHEEPRFKGELGYLKKNMIHYKHDNFSEMIEKTNQWSETEAKLLMEANHPPVVWWRFWRIMITEGVYRLIIKRGIFDGQVGIIYSIYQMWSRFLTYAKLWEMQHRIDTLKK